MGTSQEMMQDVLCYIEEHLDGELMLDTTVAFTDYSPYHVHKLFTTVCGIPLYAYIWRRQVSKRALFLIQGDLHIAEIVSACGYPSQRAFHKAFLQLYRIAPDAFRKEKSAYVLQEPLQSCRQPDINHMYADIEVQYWTKIQLEGYNVDIRHGFHVIDKCHRKCNRHLKAYPRKDPVVYGIHNYTGADMGTSQPCSQYFAGIAVEQVHRQKLMHRILSAGAYPVFSFCVDPKTSAESFAQDIYQSWLPKSAYRLRSDCCANAVGHGKENEQGTVRIEYYMSVLK